MIDPAEFSLHRYYLLTTRLRSLIDTAKRTGASEPAAEVRELIGDWFGDSLDEAAVAQLSESIDLFNAGLDLMLFYACLSTLIEGWREVNLTDERVDALLGDNAKVALLRRFRNGVFHYQVDHADARFMAWLEDDATTIWARSLHNAFNSFFTRWMRENTPSIS